MFSDNNFFEPCEEVSISETNSYIGRALILSFEVLNTQNDNMPESVVDTNGLLLLLKHTLKFEVTLVQNRTRLEVSAIIKKFCRENHPQHSAGIFMCFIISHGKGCSQFLTSDGQWMDVFEDVIQPIQNAPFMMNMKKCYILNFCRNDIINQVKFLDEMEEKQLSADQFGSPPVCFESGDKQIEDDSPIFYDHASDSCDSLHESLIKATMKTKLRRTFIAFSTLPGFSAFRDSTLGSLFVNQFVRVVAASYKTTDLMQMMEMVDRSMEKSMEDERQHFKAQRIHVQMFEWNKLVLFPNVRFITLLNLHIINLTVFTD